MHYVVTSRPTEFLRCFFQHVFFFFFPFRMFKITEFVQTSDLSWKKKRKKERKKDNDKIFTRVLSCKAGIGWKKVCLLKKQKQHQQQKTHQLCYKSQLTNKLWWHGTFEDLGYKSQLMNKLWWHGASEDVCYKSQLMDKLWWHGTSEDVTLVEFMYPVFTRMSGGVIADDSGLCCCDPCLLIAITSL